MHSESSAGLEDDPKPMRRACDICGAQPETFHGPDRRFGEDRLSKVPHVYTAQCSADDCYTGVQFSSSSAERALGMWDRYKPQATSGGTRK